MDEDEGESAASLARKALLGIIFTPTSAGQLRPYLDPITVPSQRIQSPPDLTNPILSALRPSHFPEYAREFGPAPVPLAPIGAYQGPLLKTTDGYLSDEDDDEAGDGDDDEEEFDEDAANAAKEALDGRAPPAPDRAAGNEYTSPFWTAQRKAEGENDVSGAWRAGECARHDEELSAFLVGVAAGASDEQLVEVVGATGLMYRLFGDTAYFITEYDDTGAPTVCLPVQQDKICSLSPCIFLGETTVRGRTVPYLSALLVYMFNVRGTIRHAFDQAVKDGREITYGELLGGLDSVPTLAKDVVDPGLYGVNPLGRFLIIGMSSSLGVGPRTYLYKHATYPADSKMGRVQAATPHWPGEKYALMHHGNTMALCDLPIPAAAIYAAESVMIVATGSHRTKLEDVEEELDGDNLAPFDPALADLPVIGLNSTFFDKAGAFLRQPSINVAAARQLVRRIAVLTAVGPIEDEWSEERKDTNEMKAIEARYRALFAGIFSPTITMRALYGFIRFRPAIMQRVVKEEIMQLDVARIVVERMPGKDAMAWKTRMSKYT